jgi:tetratricopeptide (TPR) repeat protein
MADSPRIEELKRRVQSDPASIAFAALAEEYRRAGRFEEAIAACRTGLQRHPSYISAHVTLGRALLEVGDYEEAREELELVLRVAPENLAAIRGLAEIHHRRGDVSDTPDDPAAESPETASAAAPAVATWANPPAATPASQYPGQSTAAVAQQTQPADPALAGLEDFLGAILRARDVPTS